MKLRITRVTSSDHGTYYCVAKNELDITKGTFIVNGLFYHFTRYHLIINNEEPSQNFLINYYNIKIKGRITFFYLT